MLTESTIAELHEMRLNVMVSSFKEQLSNHDFQSMSFEDRFSLIVDREWSNHRNNHLK